MSRQKLLSPLPRRTLGVLEKLVGGGDGGLDLRTVLGFQQREGVDEHRLVGDQLGGLLQLGQGRTGLDAGLAHGTGLQLASLGQRRQLVVRQNGTPRGIGVRRDAKAQFRRQVGGSCRCGRHSSRVRRVVPIHQRMSVVFQ